jgi:hypothetical protein
MAASGKKLRMVCLLSQNKVLNTEAIAKEQTEDRNPSLPDLQRQEASLANVAMQLSFLTASCHC